MIVVVASVVRKIFLVKELIIVVELTSILLGVLAWTTLFSRVCLR